MINLNKVKDIHLYSKAVDMRMGMNKIEILLSLTFSPLEILHSVFIFISKNKRQLKIYYEDEYGKWLMINKLSYTTYMIPNLNERFKITKTDLEHLLKGVAMISMREKMVSA